MGGTKLIHKFAASHHFKGPHDAYGKDAEVLCRTAERIQKARLASTFNVYQFCATKLPHPRSHVTVSEIVSLLPDQLPPAPLRMAKRDAELAAATVAINEAPTDAAAAEIVERVRELGLAVPDSLMGAAAVGDEPDPAQPVAADSAADDTAAAAAAAD